MVRRIVLVLAGLLFAFSGREAFAWPSPANWGCGWYGSVRPSFCNAGWGGNASWGCGPRFGGPGFCGPAWGWCGPRFYGVSSWSLGGLNVNYQGFGPAWGWGGWAPQPVVFPFVAAPVRRNLLIVGRPAPQGFGLAQQAAPAAIAPTDPSSAAQGAPSIAALRAARRSEAPDLQLAGGGNPVAEDLAVRADRSLAAGKPGVARLYLQMAIEESDGPERDALRAKLAKLDAPADPARVAGGDAAAVR